MVPVSVPGKTVPAVPVPLSVSGRLRNGKAAQRVSFGAGYPADVHADVPADVRGKNFGQALEIPEKQAFWFRSRPGKPNQRKGQNEKFMNFAHFCEFWCFSLGKQARFTLNFCSAMPLRKVHELTFLGLVCWGHSRLVRTSMTRRRGRP